MPEKKKFKLGAALETTNAFNLETTDGMTFHIEKGEMGVVGFDKYVHYLNHNLVEQIDEEKIELDGISARGLATYLTVYLDANMNLEAMLKEHNMDADMFVEYIVGAFENIGLPDDEVNNEEVTGGKDDTERNGE